MGCTFILDFILEFVNKMTCNGGVDPPLFSIACRRSTVFETSRASSCPLYFRPFVEPVDLDDRFGYGSGSHVDLSNIAYRCCFVLCRSTRSSRFRSRHQQSRNEVIEGHLKLLTSHVGSPRIASRHSTWPFVPPKTLVTLLVSSIRHTKHTGSTIVKQKDNGGPIYLEKGLHNPYPLQTRGPMLFCSCSR